VRDERAVSLCSITRAFSGFSVDAALTLEFGEDEAYAAHDVVGWGFMGR
jgi:hypothetical protein